MKSLYERELEWGKEYMDRVEKNRVHMDHADEVVAMFPELMARSNYVAGAIIVVHVKSMNEVLPVLNVLRAGGYKSKGFSDCQETARRSYHCGDITLQAALIQSKDATCRFTQVGVKEVPVMQLVCDGEPVPEAQEPQEAA